MPKIKKKTFCQSIPPHLRSKHFSEILINSAKPYFSNLISDFPLCLRGNFRRTGKNRPNPFVQKSLVYWNIFEVSTGKHKPIVIHFIINTFKTPLFTPSLKKHNEICYLEYCSYICEQYSRYGREERLYCYAGTVGKICQGIGTSCPNCHYALFGKAENVLFWGYSRRTSHCQSYRVTASERVERCGAYTGRG